MMQCKQKKLLERFAIWKCQLGWTLIRFPNKILFLNVTFKWLLLYILNLEVLDSVTIVQIKQSNLMWRKRRSQNEKNC